MIFLGSNPRSRALTAGVPCTISAAFIDSFAAAPAVYPERRQDPPVGMAPHVIAGASRRQGPGHSLDSNEYEIKSTNPLEPQVSYSRSMPSAAKPSFSRTLVEPAFPGMT